MSMVEPIRIALVKRGNLSESELARRMGISPQNLHNKMNRDNFTQSELCGKSRKHWGFNWKYLLLTLLPG